MLRSAALLAPLLTLALACTRETSAPRAPSPDRQDAGPSRADPATLKPPSNERIRKLFADAVDCPDRYRCPAIDELQRLVGTSAARAVVGVAFDLMAEGKIRASDREGKLTQHIVREWLLELRNSGKLDAETGAWCLAEMRRALATGDATLADGFQLTALNSKLPGAMDWVEQDIVSPGRPLGGACAAGRFLSGYLDDWGRVKRWLQTAGENGLAGAVCALHQLDHDLFDVAKDELPLLERAAAHAALPVEIAYPLLDHVEIHSSDPRFRAIAGRLTRHPDEAVREQATTLARAP